MKLIKCYVSSFGKLKDFSHDFSSGLNTFKEDNGWGKSTLATFIKAMFYGLSSGKRSVAENERIKFKPWNSTERFGGSVDFVWGDKQYRIERFFGNKESEDSVRLFDAVTGKEFQNTENLGKRIFEIDEEGFLSTTFFSQKDFQVKSNSSLTAKFNSVCEIQDTEAFDKALIKLEEKAKQYKYRGDKGLISDTKREVNILDEQIERAESSAVAVNVIKNDVKLSSILFGGTGTESENLIQPSTIPEGFECGTLPTISIASLNAAIDFIEENFNKIIEIEQNLTKKLISELKKLNFIELYSKECCLNVVSFNIKNLDCMLVANELNELGFCVRAGLHCSPLAHKRLNTLTSGSVRVSIDFQNTEQEICSFIGALKFVNQKLSF